MGQKALPCVSWRCAWGVAAKRGEGVIARRLDYSPADLAIASAAVRVQRALRRWASTPTLPTASFISGTRLSLSWRDSTEAHRSLLAS
jgi:hypothetical protein